MIELNSQLILWSLFSVFLLSLAFVSLIGVVRREIYIGGIKRQGLQAVISGLGYLLLFVVFGSAPILIFNDYGYSRETVIGLAVVVLSISLPLGFLWEKQMRRNFLPTYDSDHAKDVTFQNLPKNIKDKISKDDVMLILDLEFEYQQSKSLTVINEGDMRAFIISKAREKDKNFSGETVEEVIKAEGVYLKQIGVLKNKVDDKKEQRSSKSTLNLYIGTGIWRLITLGIIIGALVFARPYIITGFNDVFFIKESIFVEKIPPSATLKTLGYFEEMQEAFPRYTKGDNLKLLMQVAFANYFRDQGNYDRSINYIKNAIKKNSKFLPAYIAYGDYFIALDDTTKALEQFKIAESIESNDPFTNAALGYLYFYLGEDEKGIKYYENAIKINPSAALSNGHLIGIYAERGQLEEAVNLYYQAKRQSIDGSVLHYNAALTFLKLNRLDEARTAISKSLDKDPKNMDAYILSSRIRYLQGDKEKAIERLERVASSNPKEVKILDYLGVLYTLEGRFKEAIQTYQKALSVVEDKKEKAMIFEHLGLVYFEDNQFNLAVESFEKAKELYPEQPTTYINLGAALIKLNRLKEAKQVLEMALKLDPNDALTHNNIGDILAQEGKIKEAIIEFEKAINLDPNLKIAQENLDRYQKNR